jgi:acetylornithine deacetylase
MNDVRQLRASAAVIRAELNRREADALGILRSLLQASRNGEDAVQEVVAQRLDMLGYEPTFVRASGSVLSTAGEFAAPALIDPTVRTSVVGRSGNHASGQSLLVWAHPDGVAFDGAPGWTRDPFAGEIIDGRIYGWGIADDLSGVAAALMTADILSSLDVQLAGDLVVASTPSKGHASGVLAVLDSGQQVDAGIYLHPAENGRGLSDIKALAPGVIRFKVHVAGRAPDTAEPSHSLYVHQGEDPIEKMDMILSKLRQLVQRRSKTLHNEALQRVIGRTSSMLVSALHAEGDSPSRMPRDCTATISITSPPGEQIEDLQDEIRRTVDSVVARDGWLKQHPPEIEWLFGATAAEVSENDPLYRVVAASVEAATGAVPRYYPGHATSEIRQPMLNYGIPAVGLGPLAGSFTQAGQVDEWLDVSDYLRTIVICAAAAMRWCGTSEDEFIDIPPHPTGE